MTSLTCAASDWTGEDGAAQGDRDIHNRDVDWLRQSDGEEKHERTDVFMSITLTSLLCIIYLLLFSLMFVIKIILILVLTFYSVILLILYQI